MVDYYSYLPLHNSPSSLGRLLSQTLRTRVSRKKLVAVSFLLLTSIFLLSFPVRLWMKWWHHTGFSHRQNLAQIYIAPHSELLANYFGAGPVEPPGWFEDTYPEIASLSNPPLASYSSPPLHGGLNPSTMGIEERFETIVNPLLLLATFSVAKGFLQRSTLRDRRRDGLRWEDRKFVETVFVIGSLRPGDGTEEELEEFEKRLEAEQLLFGDLMRLDIEENMDEGKTYAFLQHVVRRAETTGPAPQFVIKVDEDTILNLPNVLGSLTSLDMSEGIYWGTSVGACISKCFPKYFQGMAYGLSYPLISHLVHSNLLSGNVRGTEDARTGSWMNSVDERTRLGRLAGEGEGKMVKWVELGTLLGGDGDWYVAKSPRWIGRHGFKDINNWMTKWAEEQVAWKSWKKRYIWWGGNEMAVRP